MTVQRGASVTKYFTLQTRKGLPPNCNRSEKHRAFLFYAFIFWRLFKEKRGDRVIQCDTSTLMLFLVMLGSDENSERTHRLRGVVEACGFPTVF